MKSFWRQKFIFSSGTPFQKSKMKYWTKLLLRIFLDWNLRFPRIGNSLWVLYFSSNMQKFVPWSSIFCLFFEQKKHSILFHCYCLIVLFMNCYNFYALWASVPIVNFSCQLLFMNDTSIIFVKDLFCICFWQALLYLHFLVLV